MKPNNTLNKLSEGESAVVDFVMPQSNIYRRLMDIGLIKGTKVQCIQQSPGGDPVAYLIRGAVIALRNEDSCNVLINGC